MLIFSRKKDETVVIPGVGEVKVIATGARVKLGFDFHADYRIYRGEIADRDAISRDPPDQEATQQPVPA